MAKVKFLKEILALHGQRLRIEGRAQQIELNKRLVELCGGADEECIIKPVRINAADSDRTHTRDNPISDALCAQLQRFLVPVSELKPFLGDILEYHLFIKSFDAWISRRTNSPT